MKLKNSILTALLAAALLLMLSGCGDNSEQETSNLGQDDVSITVVDGTDVHGWMDMALSQTPPLLAESGDNTLWLLFDGGNLLRFSSESGKWKSYLMEGLDDVVDFSLSGEIPVLLTGNELLIFSDENSEVATESLPETLTPMELSVVDDQLAVLGSDGEIAVMTEEGLQLFEPDEAIQPSGDLCRIGPDWVYRAEDGGIVLLDPSVALWQREETPPCDMMTSSSNVLFLARNDSVFVRTAPEEWEFHAQGRLYDSGLLLNDDGISSVLSPGEVIAGRPGFDPSDLLAMNQFQEPIWAMDEMGMTVYSAIGMVETNLPYYETQRVSCSLSGQGGGGMQGSAGSISDMMQSGGGTFRIYESVSVRPDPFTEFSTETRDARRNLESISVEEFRLVGITLDPVGGDQAMVEDGLGVSYVLYEGTVLANNSHVAEITSNEVIVIQDVIVDYSARGGGETTIPTIYSLRLHEEGGL
jgi:hypothetical protein